MTRIYIKLYELSKKTLNFFTAFNFLFRGAPVLCIHLVNEPRENIFKSRGDVGQSATMSKADFLFWWGNIVQLCSVTASMLTQTLFKLVQVSHSLWNPDCSSASFSVFVPPSSDQLNADTGSPSFTLIGRTTNRVLTTAALKKPTCIVPLTSSILQFLHILNGFIKGGGNSPFFLSSLFLQPVACFTCDCGVFRAPPTLRGETQSGGAKADRCGRIDLQVPAPPQEDTALHGGAIDGRGINPRRGSVTCC